MISVFSVCSVVSLSRAKPQKTRKHTEDTESERMKKYRSALDRLKKGKDTYGRPIWIDDVGKDGKPNIYYRYASDGRLMQHTRTLYGYSITPAEYTRFGEQTRITIERPTHREHR